MNKRTRKQLIARRTERLLDLYAPFKKGLVGKFPKTSEAAAFRAYTIWRIAELHITLEELSGGAIDPLEANSFDQ